LQEHIQELGKQIQDMATHIQEQEAYLEEMKSVIGLRDWELEEARSRIGELEATLDKYHRTLAYRLYALLRKDAGPNLHWPKRQENNIIGSMENKKHSLKKLKKLFWSANFEKLDIAKDKAYIIHQTLAFGTLSDIKLLFNIYSLEEVRHIFLKQPKPLYSPQGLNFLQKYILQIEDARLSKEHYVKNVFGPITRP
jgi:hypothetical protein